MKTKTQHSTFGGRYTLSDRNGRRAPIAPALGEATPLPGTRAGHRGDGPQEHALR